METHAYEKVGPTKRRIVLSDGEEVLWTSNEGSSTSYPDEIMAPMGKVP